MQFHYKNIDLICKPLLVFKLYFNVGCYTLHPCIVYILHICTTYIGRQSKAKCFKSNSKSLIWWFWLIWNLSQEHISNLQTLLALCNSESLGFIRKLYSDCISSCWILGLTETRWNLTSFLSLPTLGFHYLILLKARNRKMFDINQSSLGGERGLCIIKPSQRTQ